MRRRLEIDGNDGLFSSSLGGDSGDGEIDSGIDSPKDMFDD